MVKVEAKVVINRPVEEIFEYVIKVENNVMWQGGLEESESLSEGPLGAGSTHKEVRKFMGRKIESVVETTALEPNQVVKQKSASGPMTFETTMKFEAAEGGTMVTLKGEGDTGGLFKLADPLVSRNARKQMESDLTSLKKLLEGGN